MDDDKAPYHAHVYFTAQNRAEAAALRDQFASLKKLQGDPQIRFVGRMVDGPIGPHPEPQYEVHFDGGYRKAVIAMIEASGLTALVHPLTDDDLADHTSLGHWIGTPLELDATVLDPPGINQGIPRFGISDF